MAEEIYSHWSRAPLVIEPDYSYGWTNSTRRGFKPVGLWFDVNGKWREVAWDNDGPEYFRYRNILDIDTGALLRLSTAAEISRFTDRYASEKINPLYPVWQSDRISIDWSRLVGTYKGILIAPYSYASRRNPRTSWYDPWDCASGCIWDFSAIRGVVTTEEVALEQ